MIQTNNNTEVLGGTALMQNFNIEMNESMFTMLTKNVYTDTILAVMREWSTNAIDACIDAGKPIKYKVNLPTLLEPKFSVRDYGTGLTALEVSGLFATLGASTKRNSNKFNGTFGIGRMSGLAYTDSFIVNSYKDNTKYSYLISTDSGIPQVVSLGSIPTDEPNGLCLSVVTKTKDQKTFMTKAAQLYRFFSDKPITNQPITYPDYKIDIKGDGWFIEDTPNSDPFHNTLIVIMGNVGYEVSSHYFPSDVKGIAGMSVRLHVPLGSVSITPGREALSMDDTTVAYLTKRLKVIAEESVKEFYVALNKTPEGWKRILKYNDTYNSIPHHLRTSADYRFTPKEQNHFFNYKHRRGVVCIDCKHPEITFQLFESGRVIGKDLTSSNVITVRSKLRFMVADQRTNIKDAVKTYRDEPNVPYDIVVIVLKQKVWNKNNIKQHNITCRDYLQELGVPTWVKASENYIPQPKVVKASGVRTATDFAPVDLHCYNNSIGVNIRKGSMLSRYKNFDTFYYVEMSGFKLDNIHSKELSIYLRFLSLYQEQNQKKADFQRIKIIGVAKNSMENIKNDPRFIPLKGTMQDLVKHVNIVDYSHTTELFNKAPTYNIVNALNDQKFPVILKDYFKVLLAFEKKYPKNQQATRTDDVTTIFSCATTKPVTAYSVSKLRLDFPLLLEVIRLQHYFNTEELDNYLLRAEIQRTNKWKLKP